MEKSKAKKNAKEIEKLKKVLSDLRVIEKTLDKVDRVKGDLSRPVISEVERANRITKKLKERVRDVLASLTPI